MTYQQRPLYVPGLKYDMLICRYTYLYNIKYAYICIHTVCIPNLQYAIMCILAYITVRSPRPHSSCHTICRLLASLLRAAQRQCLHSDYSSYFRL